MTVHTDTLHYTQWQTRMHIHKHITLQYTHTCTHTHTHTHTSTVTDKHACTQHTLHYTHTHTHYTIHTHSYYSTCTHTCAHAHTHTHLAGTWLVATTVEVLSASEHWLADDGARSVWLFLGGVVVSREVWTAFSSRIQNLVPLVPVSFTACRDHHYTLTTG